MPVGGKATRKKRKWPAVIAPRFREQHAVSTGRQPPPALTPAVDLDTAKLDQINGRQGAANGGVYQFAVPGEISPWKAECGEHPLGGANAINFQPPESKAAITGDFLVTGGTRSTL